MRAVKEDFALVECFDSETNAWVISSPCRLRGAFSRALNAWLAVLTNTPLRT
jgi:Rrf2 family transcriptional regulator, nitric oxide-sensitive transcriptional repressor